MINKSLLRLMRNIIAIVLNNGNTQKQLIPCVTRLEWPPL
jgi:hypothetical protein